MTPEQRRFWEDVRDFARARRCGRRISLDVAADALALEKEIEQRLAAEEPLAAVAEDTDTEGR